MIVLLVKNGGVGVSANIIIFFIVAAHAQTLEFAAHGQTAARGYYKRRAAHGEKKEAQRWV